MTHRRTGSEQAKLGENILYVIHWLIAGWRFFFRDLQTLSRKLQLCLQKLEIPSSETKTHFSRTIFFEDKTLSSGTTPNRLQKCQTLFCGNYMITWHIGELHFSCHIKIAARVFLPFSCFFLHFRNVFWGPTSFYIAALVWKSRNAGRAVKNNRTKVCASV